MLVDSYLPALDGNGTDREQFASESLTDSHEFPAVICRQIDMYVEDQCAAYVRYCFKEPMDAAIFRSRFEPKSQAFRLAG